MGEFFFFEVSFDRINIKKYINNYKYLAKKKTEKQIGTH